MAVFTYKATDLSSAEQTGTIAADGFPCRRMTVRWPPCWAWLTNAESWALALASEVVRMRPI